MTTVRFRANEKGWFANSYRIAFGNRTDYPTQYAHQLQVTSSESNPYFLLGRGDPRDIGGPFETANISIGPYSLDPLLLQHYAGNGSVQYECYTAIVPNGTVSDLLRNIPLQNTLAKANSYMQTRVPSRPDATALDALGAKAVNAVKPTSPVVDLSMSIGEFISERKFFSLPGRAGSVEGEYLNYMFGIAPTIADVQDLRTAIEDKEKIIRQYVRDSGRRIRRQYDFPLQTNVTELVTSNVFPASVGAPIDVNLVSRGTLHTHTRTRTKSWFSGAFTYYLPPEGWSRDLVLMDKLYGVVPGSALAWELLPFSWLVDYKTSIGAALSNLDSFAQDGLLMPYGYIMHHQQVETEYTWKGDVKEHGSWRSYASTYTVTTERKMRQPANPFGFGIVPGDLTPRQLSIIAALGLATVRQK